MANSLAVLFAKPHVLGSQEMFFHFDRQVRALGFEILDNTTRRLDANLLFLTYLPHAFFAFEPVADHAQYLQPQAVVKIEQSTGNSLETLIKSGTLKSAAEALRDLGINPAELYSEWIQPTSFERIQIGYQINRLLYSSSTPIWVVNGYFPYRFSLYQKSSDTVPAWLLKIPAGMSVSEARTKLVGGTSSSDETLRGYLANHHKRLSIHVDEFSNGFHMSDSESASIRETAVWFPSRLLEQPLVAGLISKDNFVPNGFVSALAGVSASIRLSACASQSETLRVLSDLARRFGIRTL